MIVNFLVTQSFLLILPVQQAGQRRQTGINLPGLTGALGLISVTAADRAQALAVLLAQISHIDLQNQRRDEDILDLDCVFLERKHIVLFFGSGIS